MAKFEMLVDKVHEIVDERYPLGDKETDDLVIWEVSHKRGRVTIQTLREMVRGRMLKIEDRWFDGMDKVIQSIADDDYDSACEAYDSMPEKYAQCIHPDILDYLV